MSNSFFQFKQFTIQQDRCAMKVTTDGCLFGAWVAERVVSRESLVVSRELGGRTILDIGTGTGLLSLMLAQKNELTIDAIEIDQDAFEQASENVAASRWADRIKVIHADARAPIAIGVKSTSQFDTIISNPPFYEKEFKGDDSKKNIAHHNEGLLLPELLSIIKGNLKQGGTFYLLLPFKRNEEIRKLLTEHEFLIQQMVFIRQSVNHDYFRIMLEGTLKIVERVETKIDEISIKDEQGQYSPAFINLLKEYYLHL